MDWKISSWAIKRIIAIKIEPGEDPLDCLGNIVNKIRIKTGVIVSAVGSLEKGMLRKVKRFPEKFPIGRTD